MGFKEMTTEIILSPNEMYVSAIVGLRRQLSSKVYGHKNTYGSERNDIAKQWYINVMGAQGEMAGAKALGLYWPASVNAPKSDPDIWPDWQIRTRTNTNNVELIVRDDDIDEHKYLLVSGTGPEFLIHGWIKGKDAKRKEWYADKGGRNSPCFWVPPSKLTAI